MRRYNRMKTSFLGGMIAGALVGSAITMAIDPINDKQRRKMHRGASSMFKTMGSVLDAMMDK